MLNLTIRSDSCKLYEVALQNNKARNIKLVCGFIENENHIESFSILVLFCKGARSLAKNDKLKKLP